MVWRSFVITKVKNTVPWTYVINDLNGEEIVGTFYEKELQKTNQQEFRVKKVIKNKGDKLYVKWKDYDVKNNVVKKTEYDKLAAKVSNIDTSTFVLKTKYDIDKTIKK